MRLCGICGEEFTEVYRSPYFCAPCDKERIARISEQFKEIGETWPKAPVAQKQE